MAVDTEVGQINLRTQYIDGMVKAIAPRMYKFKQALTIQSTSAWKNFFFREDPTVLTAKGTRSIKGIPRGADFPNAVPIWEKLNVTIEKYGLETNIPWEDTLSDEINVRDRSLVKITEGVVKSVDDSIWTALSTDTGIQSLTIGKSGAATNTSGSWNETSAAIIDDLLQASQKIAEQNYSTNNLMAFVSPLDKRSIMKYLTDKGAQFPKLSEGVADNGVIGNLAGITLVESNSVTASQALIVVPKRCATWKELVPLQSGVAKEDLYKSYTIRAVELGVVEVTDPLSIFWLKGTQA